mmetsp:Transcript_27261/g.39068  ORF Transcript_27261/g.39068 Transcript_27261/m.39068 type:complete len:344 (+) Transcript_27261:2-1033(+)
MRLPTQVGGFSHPPVLKMEPNFILKPLHSNNRGLRELAFYEAIRTCCSSSFRIDNEVANYLESMRINTIEEDTTENVGMFPTIGRNHAITSWGILDKLVLWIATTLIPDPCLLDAENSLLLSRNILQKEVQMLRQLSHFVPSYHGLSPTAQGGDYIVLRDLTAHYTNPCVLDLKMGVQTYEPDDSWEKQVKNKCKYPQQELFGLRIVGMRIICHDTTDDPQRYQLYDKHYGYSITSETQLQAAFRLYFTSNRQIQKSVILEFTNQLQNIRSWFEQNQSLCFYSSSLLLVYDGCGNNDNATSSRRPILRMIDLGHVRRNLGGDHGYLFGIQTLEKHLQILLEGG